MNNKKAFTLVELMVALFIISFLIFSVFLFTNSSRSQGRDLKVLANISQVQIALDYYNTSEGSYPDFLSPGYQLTGLESGFIFMPKVPETISSSDYSYNPIDNSYEISFYLERAVDIYQPGPKCAVPGKILEGPCCNPVFDNEGNLYPVVVIGDQCWMAQNLKTGEMLCSSYGPDHYCPETSSDNGIIEKYCYLNIEENCESLGGLYSWKEAMNYNPFQSEDICPAGWHIPSDEDWHVLEKYLSDENETCKSERWGESSCLSAGKKLKEESLEPSTPWFGDNSSAFSARASGFFDGQYFSNQAVAFFWSPSYDFPDISRQIVYNEDGIYRDRDHLVHAAAIRCLKD